MNGNDDTPGIAQHLKDSDTVWDHGRFDFGSVGGENYRRHSGTFFTSTRTASYNRFYVVGDVMRQTQEGGNVLAPSFAQAGPPLPFSEKTTVSPDAQAEAFPAANTGPNPAVVNTEEFLDYARVLFPLQDIVSMAAYSQGQNTVSPGITVLACDSAGRLYSCGQHSGSPPSFPDIFNRNPLGHGPKKEFTSGQLAIDPRRANVLQRVYGEDDDFSAIKFVRVAASRRTSFALSEDGDIYMAGDVSSFGQAGDFPENSTDLPWFRKKEVTEYYDSSAALVSGSLTFTEIWAGGDLRPVLMAKTDDDRLFICGKFVLGVARDSPVFHEVGGFVTSVTFTSFGNDYTNASPPVITVSNPDNPYGTKPVFEVLPKTFPSPGGLTAIRIVNAGWGYSSPPTITFTGSNNNATATCTVFGKTWRTAAISKGVAGDRAASAIEGTLENYAAVTEPDGELYIWGNYALWNVNPTTWGKTGVLEINDTNVPAGFSPRNAPGPVALSSPLSLVSEVDLGSFHGLVRIFSTVHAFGLKDRTPDSIDLPYFDVIASPTGFQFSCDSIVCMGQGGAMRQIGARGQASGSRVFSYGKITSGRDTLGQGKDGFVADGTDGNRKLHPILGSRVWAKVLAGTHRGFCLLRWPVTVDEYGLITVTPGQFSDNFAFKPLPPYEAPAP